MTAPATLRDRTAAGPSAPPRRRAPRIRALKRLPVQVLVAILLIVEIYPLVWLFMGSFKTQDEFLNSPVWTLPQNFNFDNYTEAWTTGNLATYVRNSLIATIPSLLPHRALRRRRRLRPRGPGVEGPQRRPAHVPRRHHGPGPDDPAAAVLRLLPGRA